MKERCILIVEDEFIVANDLKMTLEKEGYVVIGIAPSFKVASALIQTKQPDLVLLDIHLKGKQTGIEFAGILRKQNIAFVYLSANSDQQVLEAAKATEPYGFLVKPFREKDLLVTLDIALYRHEHTLAAENRKKKQLEKQLEVISTISHNETGKLLQTALALQQHLPFDFISISRPASLQQEYHGYHFLRIAFEQYQEIGVKELLTISGLHQNAMKTILAASPADEQAGYHNENEFTVICRNNPLKRLFAKTFDLASHMQLPFNTRDGICLSLSLFSRKTNLYDASHLSLLEHLKDYLSDVIQSCFPANAAVSLVTEVKNPDPHNPKSHVVFPGVIGNSSEMLNVLDLVCQVAPLNTSVLITGESGTGKEVIADCINNHSEKKGRPFIKVNCAALPATLIESELFGHEKGSFTGAIDRKIGKFEQADGGTIFLDEIGEMTLDMQVKLLRVLQAREIERVGGSSTIKIDVRVIAATNRNLEKEVSHGRFRLDLYFRINVFPINIPPLRERKQDIKLLSEYFARQISARFQKEYTGISNEMMDTLQSYQWPGNIRELENTIEQSVILNDVKTPLVLKRPLRSINFENNGLTETTSLYSGARTMTDIKNIHTETERDYIVTALKKSAGRIRGLGGAAAILNLKPTTLESRMVKLGIRKEEYL
ncbi:MAG: response regulator [Chitinophagaceae bacterium]|nr:MAG: response regulator [Chitinophagaceae bacterium]